MKPPLENAEAPRSSPPHEVVRALFTHREVEMVMQRHESTISRYVSDGSLRGTRVAGYQRMQFDRRDVESLIRRCLPEPEREPAERRLLGLALGELVCVGGRKVLIETGEPSVTGAYLDRELFALVRTAAMPDQEAYDQWARARGAPTSTQLMQRLAVFSWEQLTHTAQRTGGPLAEAIRRA